MNGFSNNNPNQGQNNGFNTFGGEDFDFEQNSHQSQQNVRNQRRGNRRPGPNPGGRQPMPNKKIGINDILLAPLSALYAFMLKIQEGFKLDEEVKVLATVQILYLILGLITGAKIYLILTIGNILSIVVVLILASSYINLPDYLSPGGMINRIKNQPPDDQYAEAYNTYIRENGEMGQGQDPMQGQRQRPMQGQGQGQYGQQPGQGGNPNQQPYPPQQNNNNNNNNIQFNENNTQGTHPNQPDEFRNTRSQVNNMASDMYNQMSQDTNPFNKAGLIGNQDYNNDVNFGINNTDGVNGYDREVKVPDQFANKIVEDTRPVENIDFTRINSNIITPNSANAFRHPQKTREQLYEENPYRERMISNPADAEQMINNCRPHGNYNKRQDPKHKIAKNLKEMIMDGFASSLANSTIAKDDEEFELL